MSPILIEVRDISLYVSLILGGAAVFIFKTSGDGFLFMAIGMIIIMILKAYDES